MHTNSALQDTTIHSSTFVVVYKYYFFFIIFYGLAFKGLM